MKIILTKDSLLRISFFTFVVFMPFGYKLGGRFAISNIGQILSFILIVPVIFKGIKISKQYFIYNLWNILLMFIAAVITSVRYGISLHLGHIGFFSLVCIYLSFFIMVEGRKREKIVTIINDSLQTAAELFAVPYLLYGVDYIIIRHHVYSSYMFDDKSHAVIFFMFLAFFSLKKENMKYNTIISLLYFTLSLTTTSRLGIIFIPFYAAAFYWKFIKKRVGVFEKIVLSLIALGIIVTIGWLIYKNYQYFSVFNRMSNSSGSTKSHLVLIKYALKIKFMNIGNFLLGTGPGMFSNVLVASNMNLTEIMPDYSSYAVILQGYLPVHSSHVELFMDFSLPAFLCYVKFLVSIYYQQWKAGNYIDRFFFIAFIGAEIFYSTFHEILFYVVLLYLYVNSDIKKQNE